MTWQEFTKLKDDLATVCIKVSDNNTKDQNSLKSIDRYFIYFLGSSVALSTLVESNFEDLSYRYLASDEDLNLLSEEVASFLN